MSIEPRQLSSRGPSHNGSIPRPPGALSSRENSRRGPAAALSTPRGPAEPQYTVYIRLPFPRNGFVDPPRVGLREGGSCESGGTLVDTRQVEWDATKERYLWKVISRGNRNADVDCKPSHPASLCNVLISSRGCTVLFLSPPFHDPRHSRVLVPSTSKSRTPSSSSKPPGSTNASYPKSKRECGECPRAQAAH